MRTVTGTSLLFRKVNFLAHVVSLLGFCASFGVGLTSCHAWAQASALQGTIPLSVRELAICSIDRETNAQMRALQVATQICNQQSAKLAAQGFPFCEKDMCFQKLVYRSGATPREVKWHLRFDTLYQSVSLSIDMPVGTYDSSSGWAIDCSDPVSFLTTNGLLNRPDGFFDRWLDAIPDCTQNSEPSAFTEE